MTTIVIIGADRGIGAAMMRDYHVKGKRVIGACFGDGLQLSEDGMEVVPKVDVREMSSFRPLSEYLGNLRIDILVCVAGIALVDRWGKFDYDLLMEQYNVNTLGPLRTVQALDAHLGKGSKIGILTSRVGSVTDNSSGGLYGYRMSKSAANQLGVNLYHELKPRGVAVMLLHPGQVATDMTKGFSDVGDFITPEESAAGLITQLDRLNGDTPPEFRHMDGTLLPW